MNKIDARKLSLDALKVLRGQALRMRETFQLPWCEIARVMGVHVAMVLAWAQRYASEVEAGLESRKPGRAYFSGRTLSNYSAPPVQLSRYPARFPVNCLT